MRRPKSKSVIKTVSKMKRMYTHTSQSWRFRYEGQHGCNDQDRCLTVCDADGPLPDLSDLVAMGELGLRRFMGSVPRQELAKEHAELAILRVDSGLRGCGSKSTA